MPQTAPAQRSMTPLEWGMLLILSLVWGGSFFFNQIALRDLPVFTVVASRVGLAALILLAIMALRGEKMPRDRRVWLAFFGMGLLNNAIPFTLIVAGQQHLSSGVAAILNASTPLFTVILAHLLTSDERMTANKAVGVLIGFAGVAAMIGLGSLRHMGAAVIAEALILGAAISYGLAGIFGRRFRRMGVSPMATATGQVIASSLILLPVALVVDRPWLLPMPSAAAIGAVLGVAAISTALAYVLYFRILATAGATNLALVTFLIPVSAILLGSLVLGETLMPRHVLGMALISVGLAAIDGRLWRAVAARRHAA